MDSTSKLRSAVQATQGTKPPDTIQITVTILSLIVGAPVLAVVLVAIVAISGSSSVSPDALGPSNAMAIFSDGAGDALSALTDADGKGAFVADAIPDPALVPALERAGQQCRFVSPVILAAQIEVGSQFDPQKVGPGGELGIAQLPAEVFTKYGHDDDGNGDASVLDSVDAIFAQARYLCALADSVETMRSAGAIAGDQLTLTLLAWDVGIDNLKATLSLPVLDPQSYPFQVRAQFAKFETDELPLQQSPSR